MGWAAVSPLLFRPSLQVHLEGGRRLIRLSQTEEPR